MPHPGDQLGSQCVGEHCSACQGLAALALRGSQRHHPCTHQRETLLVPPSVSPSQLETLKAALAAGVGEVGMGPPHAHPKKLLSCSEAPASPNISSALLTSSWSRKREGITTPAEGQGGSAQKSSPTALPLSKQLCRRNL